MAVDLLIEDLGEGDIVFPLRLVTGVDLIRQRMLRRLRTFLGEWFLNPESGLDYIGWAATRPVPLAAISGRTRQAVEGVPGVLRVLSWDATHAGRTVTITGAVLIEGGLELSFTAAVRATAPAAEQGAPWLWTLQELL